MRSSKARQKHHSYKQFANLLACTSLVIAGALFTSWSYFYLEVRESANTTEDQSALFFIVFFAATALVILLKRHPLYEASVRFFPFLRKFDSRDKENHRREYKALAGQCRGSTLFNTAFLWLLYCGIHMGAAALGGLAFGQAIKGGMFTMIAFVGTQAAVFALYGLYCYRRLVRERKRAADPYGGSHGF